MHCLLALVIFIQFAFFAHAVYSGKSIFWCCLALCLPVFGPLAYIFLNILPETNNISENYLPEKNKKNDKQEVSNTLELERLRIEYAYTESPKLRLMLADEYFFNAMYDKAAFLYNQSLLENDSDDIRLDLAYAYFYDHKFLYAKETLEIIISNNPYYQVQRVNLLLAKSHANLSENEKADLFFRKAVKYDNSPEAKCSYGLFLKNINKSSQANNIFQEVLNDNKLRKTSSDWIRLAEENLRF